MKRCARRAAQAVGLRGESRVGEALVPQHLGEQGHAPAAVLRVHGPGGDVADERCLAVHLPPGDDGANEANDCVAVEEHEAASVIGPVMVEQPAPGGGLDADSRKVSSRKRQTGSMVVLTRGTEMRPRPTSLLRRHRLRADGQGRGQAFDRRRRQQGGEGQGMPSIALDLEQQVHHRQRVRAEAKKIIGPADGRDAQHALADRLQLPAAARHHP